MQVLLQETTQRVPAALSGLATFVKNLKLLVEAQQAVATAGSSGTHSPAEAQQAQQGVRAEAEEDGLAPMEAAPSGMGESPTGGVPRAMTGAIDCR